MDLNQPYYIEKRIKEGQHLSLNGQWSFCSLDQETASPEALPFTYEGRIPAATYFNVYEAGLLPHPYYGTNSLQYRFIDQKIWYYRRRFSLRGYENLGKAYLCLDGAGYFTKIWLNGTLLGEHEGIFGGPITEVSEWLRYGEENELIVQIKSCNYGIPDEEWKQIYRSSAKRAIIPWNMVKDSGTSNGCFTVMGIYRDVRLEFMPALHMSRPYLVTEEIREGEAKLSLSVEIASEGIDELKVPMNDVQGDRYVYGYVNGINAFPGELSVEIRIELEEKKTGKTVYSHTGEKRLYDYERVGIDPKYHECQFYEFSFVLEDPLLWYPQGLGEPDLYSVRLTLFCEGRERDFLCFDFGIRTFELVRTAGERMRGRWGAFQSVVNGKRFFLKGMNWTPLDAVLDVSEQDYRWSLELAKAEGVQMLRVWGAGNAPEHDVFYQLCNEYGIMVWQDGFISNHSNPYWDKELFKCQQCMYLYRLRNHPSLVIHCSGNENNPYATDNHVVWVWQRETEDIDPYRVRIRTTPDKGSAHIYQGFEPCWFRKMYTQLPFLGEGGTHTFPNEKTIRQLISREEFERRIPKFGSEDMGELYPELVNHFTENDAWGVQKKVPALSHMIKLENVSVEELCAASAMASYEYYQFMVQAMREQYPVTGGILPWVFERPWSTFAVQMVDGMGDPVAPYYAVKNGYLPTEVHLALQELVYGAGETVELSLRIINESGKERNGIVGLRVFDPGLTCIWEKSISLTVPADRYQTILPKEEFVVPEKFEDTFFFLQAALYEDGKKISQSFYWPLVLKEMRDPEFRKKRREKACNTLLLEDGPHLMQQFAERCPKAALTVEAEEVSRENDRIHMVLTVKNHQEIPAFPVKINIKEFGAVHYLDDDCFFMEGREERKLRLTVRCEERGLQALTVSVSAWNAPAYEITV